MPCGFRVWGRLGALKKLNPKIIIIGEAPAQHLNYYANFNTITQNTAGDISIECISNIAHFYVSNNSYSVTSLTNKNIGNTHGKYIGSLVI